jgi:hypothetical protein
MPKTSPLEDSRGPTNAPSIMIGGRAAELIKAAG